VTVPAELVPPSTDVGLSETETNPGAITVSVDVLVVDPKDPLMVAVRFDATAVVETVNVAVV